MPVAEPPPTPGRVSDIGILDVLDRVSGRPSRPGLGVRLRPAVSLAITPATTVSVPA